MRSLGGTWAVLGGRRGPLPPPRCVSYSRLPPGPCRAGQGPALALLALPGTLSIGIAPLTPDSHQWGPCRLPPSVPGKGGPPPGRGPELLVTSYLLPWDWLCCCAGQREVTPPACGCACLPAFPDSPTAHCHPLQGTPSFTCPPGRGGRTDGLVLRVYFDLFQLLASTAPPP